MKKRIFRTILLVSVVVLVIGLGSLFAVLYGNFSGQIERELQKEAGYLALAVESSGAEVLNELSSGADRVTLIDGQGNVLFDNEADASEMENHADREEIQEAMENGSGEAIRQSSTLSEQTIYYAQRLSDGTILRVSSTQYTVLRVLYGMIQPVLLVVVLILILSGVFSSYLSKRIVAPINEMDPEHPDESGIYDELSPLITKINRQQKTIRHQIAEAKRQQDEFSIITGNMSEGLLVLDKNAEVLSYNPSALHLLGVSAVPENKSVFALNRSEGFSKAVDKALAGEHENKALEIQGKICRIIINPVIREGETVGAVALLVDETEKTERENLRREFTANVSHELKTPLTSISGFAEIMKDGLVKPEDTKRFAGYIFREAQRLITLVGDTIKISQMDEECLADEQEEIDLYQAAGSILARLEDTAKKQNILLRLEGTHAKKKLTRTVLEEVLYNLCDNAIKYNKKDGTVTVTIEEHDSEIVVAVADTGIGIPPAHQDRVFERFYCVDKSRSKEVGGTGLGLSIVKHGAAYLGAELQMQSVPEQGTTFRLIWKKDE